MSDIEHIPAFVLIGLFYVLTQPEPSIAAWHFRLFYISRVTGMLSLHKPAPAILVKGLSYITGSAYAVTLSMALQVLKVACYEDSSLYSQL